MENKKWVHTHKQLHHTLSKEIGIRQELLGNMHQMEYVLLTGNRELKESIYFKCNELINKLRMMGREKSILIRTLFRPLPEKHRRESIEEMLNPLVEVESETLQLYQHTKHLTAKIHGQHLRNKTLSSLMQKGGPLRINNGVLQSEIKVNGGKKRCLITIDYPSEKID